MKVFRPNVNEAELAKLLAKTVRDFEDYFKTVDHPKLEEWLEDTLKENL